MAQPLLEIAHQVAQFFHCSVRVWDDHRNAMHTDWGDATEVSLGGGVCKYGISDYEHRSSLSPVSITLSVPFYWNLSEKKQMSLPDDTHLIKFYYCNSTGFSPKTPF